MLERVNKRRQASMSHLYTNGWASLISGDATPGTSTQRGGICTTSKAIFDNIVTGR
jgi:hypothetical protein